MESSSPADGEITQYVPDGSAQSCVAIRGICGQPPKTNREDFNDGFDSRNYALEMLRLRETLRRNAQMELMSYYDGHNLPYYDKIELDENGWVVTPPADHRLSDALVFLVIGQNLVVTRNRHGKWPADFNSDGDIYPMAIGRPTGSHLHKYMWLLTKKVAYAKMKHTGRHLGEVTVSPKELRAPFDSDTAFNVDFDSYDWSKFTPIPTFDCATKRLVLALQGSGVIITPPANIRGFNPAAGPTKTNFANRLVDIDQTTWSSMANASYQRISSFSLLDKNAARTMPKSLDKMENVTKVEPSLYRDIPRETSATVFDDWLAILDGRNRSFTRTSEALQPP
ncbi:hypothetical protein N7519_011444 [Penicillium mononematosum]|uniref:uncharacterized protein n=1 Tax=Penicillium mononematosum TaxID=268346 RepID=UPI002548813A|nr:uncharacterized protein N7519_011444 [Penicillium mononematosum]KAJ6180983.1 hypothetical protein N7519_011444 [Penicillium mononematosum]